MNHAKLALVLVCALLAACLFCGCTQQQSQTQKEPEYKAELIQGDTLKVLIAPDYPPFAAGSGADVWGYDIAVAQEIANRLNLQLEFVETSRTKLLSVLTCEPESVAAATTAATTAAPASEPEEPEPQADIAIGALAITPERDDKVDFSSWYCIGDQAVICRKPVGEQGTESSKYPTDARKQSSKTTAKQPDSKANNVTYLSTADFDRETTRIAVVKGSTCLDTAKTLTNEKLIAEYSSAQKCLQALQAKEVQAVVLDLPVANYYLQQGFADLQIIEYIMTGEAYGIALPSDSSHLKDAINEIIAEMEEDGTLDRLASEYLQ